MTKEGRSKPVVGLSGGIGSGKSTVASILADLGAAVISSDALNTLELASPEVQQTLIGWWGDSIRSPEGGVDRRKVSELIFGDESQRLRLQALLHPRIAARRSVLMADAEVNPTVRMVVVDSPLLFETGLDQMCDTVVFVDTTEELRKGRSEKARHWTPGELKRRENSQYPLDMKRARADHMVHNNSTLTDLRQQVERVFAAVLADFGERS